MTTMTTESEQPSASHKFIRPGYLSEVPRILAQCVECREPTLVQKPLPFKGRPWDEPAPEDCSCRKRAGQLARLLREKEARLEAERRWAAEIRERWGYDEFPLNEMTFGRWKAEYHPEEADRIDPRSQQKIGTLQVRKRMEEIYLDTRRFGQEFAMNRPRTGLWFRGKPGRGKSMWLAGLCDYLTAVHNIPAVMTNCPRFFEIQKKTYTMIPQAEKDRLWMDALTAPLLVMDDLFANGLEGGWETDWMLGKVLALVETHPGRCICGSMNRPMSDIVGEIKSRRVVEQIERIMGRIDMRVRIINVPNQAANVRELLAAEARKHDLFSPLSLRPSRKEQD
jgi:DNA replication protein DnaC